MNIFKIRGNKDIKLLIISIIITEFIGWGATLFLDKNAKIFFEMLNKPIFSPSRYLFSIMWTILYFIIAIAAYRIWFLGKRGLNIRNALLLYFIQLILNFVWTMMFFRFKLLWITFLESLVLFVFIMMTLLEFKRFDKISFYLMIPYAMWEAFSIILSYSIWGLNLA